MVCVLSQLKPSEFYIPSCEKGLGLRPRPFSTAKNVELLGLHPIRDGHFFGHWVEIAVSHRHVKNVDFSG